MQWGWHSTTYSTPTSVPPPQKKSSFKKYAVKMNRSAFLNGFLFRELEWGESWVHLVSRPILRAPRDRFSPSTSIFPANSHSTYCSTLFISRLGLVQQAKQWPTYQMDPISPHFKKLKIKQVHSVTSRRIHIFQMYVRKLWATFCTTPFLHMQIAELSSTL
jgi:hypothetical protein